MAGTYSFPLSVGRDAPAITHHNMKKPLHTKDRPVSNKSSLLTCLYVVGLWSEECHQSRKTPSDNKFSTYLSITPIF